MKMAAGYRENVTKKLASGNENIIEEISNGVKASA